MTALAQRINALLDKCNTEPWRLPPAERAEYDRLTSEWYDDNQPHHPSQVLSAFI